MAPATNSSALSNTECDIINIKELENSWSKCSIYRVPCNLRKVNMEAYTPQLISIGPLHHGKEEFKLMEEQKEKYLSFFKKRVSSEALKGYESYLEINADNIRNCYAQIPDIRKDKFVNLILLDAVFIIEHMLRIRSLKSEYKSKNKEVNSESFRSWHTDDYVLTQSWLSKSIHRDLLLLENQLPMFVLKTLYESVYLVDNKRPDEHDQQNFLDVALDYFAIYDKPSSDETKQNLEESKHFTDEGDHQKCKLMKKMKQSKEPKHFTGLEDHRKCKLMKKMKEPKHFTDLIRYFYLPTNLGSCNHSPSNVLRTVTKLREAGVSFERVHRESCLLDIEFDKKPILSWFLCLGCLSPFKYCKALILIPQLKVDDTTECVFRNLIAFEQCHYPLEPYICNYVSLIDSLIHTKDDVELLVEKEIIVHELGSDKEVATLVNGLCKHVVVHTTFYGEVIDDVNKHYQSTWYHYMAALRLVYFRDPWRASSTVVGIAVLVFTIFNFYRVTSLIF